MVLCFPPPLLLYIHSLPFQPGYHIVIPNGLVIRPWPLDRSAGCGFWSLLLQSCLLVCIFLALQPRSLSPCGGFCFLDLETKSLSLGYCLWFFDSLLLILDPWFLSISWTLVPWVFLRYLVLAHSSWSSTLGYLGWDLTLGYLGSWTLVLWVSLFGAGFCPWLIVLGSWVLVLWFWLLTLGPWILSIRKWCGINSLFLALESWFFGFGFWLLVLEFWV